MDLTTEEREILEGKHGTFRQMCMNWLVEWGTAMNAKKMVPVSNVHVLFSDQGNCIRGADLETIRFFYNELMTALNAGAKCYTTTDVSYICDDLWDELHTDWIQVENNRNLLKTALGTGFNMVWTCIPYFIGSLPLKGEICAWAESSCIPFCNSVLGARTTRHSQTSSMAAAVLGLTPEFGELLDENRIGEILIDVDVELKTHTDWGALGDYVGMLAGLKKPVFKTKNRPIVESLSQLGASLATTGGTAMYHVIGITPEALTEDMAFNGKKPQDVIRFSKKELESAYQQLSVKDDEIEICVLGCPHLNLKEFECISNYADGRKVAEGKQMWICTAYQIVCQAERLGYREVIEATGAKIMVDSCPAVACWGEWRGKRIMTDSFKQGRYLLAQGNQMAVRNVKTCIDSVMDPYKK